jgi:hypothetical protein
MDDNPEAKAECIRRTTGEGWDAFSFFCHTYFPHIFPLPFCPAHETMFDEAGSVSQFLTYPDGYIDGCDALAGCLERFSEYDIGRNRVKVRRFSF